MNQVKEKMRRMKENPRRIGHNLYCSAKCYRDAKKKQAYTRYTNCCECGVTVRGHKDIEYRKRCGECHNARLCKYFTIDEVLYLARLNPSVGITYFIESIYLGKGPKYPASIKHKLMSFFEMIEEEEGVNYYEWLQSRKYLVKIGLDDVPSEKMKFTRGQRRSVPATQHRNKRMREGHTMKHQKYVYIPPDFKWGKLEGLKDKFSKLDTEES